MITITELDSICLAAVAACTNIEEHVLISTEQELKDVIATVKSYPLLVCVIPTASGEDKSLDNMAENNNALFYVLAPMKQKFSKKERNEVWQKTQDGMKDLKRFIKNQMSGQGEKFYYVFNNAEFNKRTIEPEYDFLQNVGWSLSFDFITDDL